MRDIAITLIVLIGCLYTLKKPYIGVLLWSWLSYMNPHRLAFGFAYDMPFAQVTALVLIGSVLFSKETKKLPINLITIIWIGFILFMGITTLFAYYPDSAQIYYIRVLKIQLITFITMLVVRDMNKLKQLIWVIVLSIGYFSVKGGLFTLMTGGGHRVWGPADSMIEGNNELAVASLMIIPLMAFLYQSHDKWWIKKGLLAAMFLSFFAAIGTQSRGALIAFATVSLFFWFKSERKIIIGIGMTILTIGIVTFMPSSWHERMHSIENYEEDSSSMGRLNAWEYAYNAANHNLLGLGFESWNFETFAMYAPNPLDIHVAHSIYFSLLADHGWLGLFIFLLIYYLSWKNLNNLIKTKNPDPEQQEIIFLSKMIQISFIAYLTGAHF